MNITIYSRQTCAPCRTLKTYLNNKGISFTNKDVDEDLDAQAEAFAYAGFSTVPVTVVEKDGNRQVITGLNLKQLIPAIQ